MDRKIIEKYLRGIASTHEKEEVMRWVEKEEKNKHDFLELRKLYDISVWNTELAPDKKTRKSTPTTILWRAAAVILALVCLSLGYLLSSEEEAQMSVETIICPQGQRLELVLSDGTNVWLNSNSTLSFQKNKNEKTRVVELDGEAYFDVAHDKKHPFIVQTDLFDITVLGTSFNVFSYRRAGLFECSLVGGSVTLRNKQENSEIRLQPNEMIRVENGAALRSQIAADESFLWKAGIYSFKNQPLSEVFTRLSVLHEVNIIVKNQQISEQMCTGKFRNKDGIHHVLSTLQKNYQFSFIEEEDTQTYIIY